MRMSFKGMVSNALSDLKKLDTMARNHEDYFDHENAAGSITLCISALHDTVLALVSGDAIVEEVRDFFFNDCPPKSMVYDGMIVKFDKSKSTRAPVPPPPPTDYRKMP